MRQALLVRPLRRLMRAALRGKAHSMARRIAELLSGYCNRARNLARLKAIARSPWNVTSWPILWFVGSKIR